MDAAGITYPVFDVGSDILEVYYAGREVRVPFNIFYGKDGKVRKRELGYNEEKKKEFEEEVEKLLKE